MKTKEEIKKLLNKSPHLRDSDAKLIATYWYNEIRAKNLDLNTMTGFEFVKMFAESKLTNPETIRRMRAKIQEESPEYRGQVYKFRNHKKQKEWRKKLGYENHMSCKIPRIGYDEY
jgi:hypothetical protein